jgi:RNA polymerase sigma factor (TIGR02999 family)
MSEVTRILSAIEQGDSQAAGQLLPLVYDELRRLAAAHMAQEKPGHTLDATALVHEAYLRLVGPSPQPLLPAEENEGTAWQGRRHFFAAAAEAMRRILVESARRRAADKRGGGRRRLPLDEAQRITESPEGLIALHEVLDQFAALAPDRAELVKLRFFAGLSMPEAAAALGISLATAERWWRYARTWLYASLGSEEKSDSP